MDNIIPDECAFSGTLRTFDDATAAELLDAVRRVCSATAEAHRVQCRFEIGSGYPAVVNPPSGVEVARAAARAAGLPVRELTRTAMSSEDFAYFLLNAPDGVFVRLGAGEDQPPLHSSRFLPPDEVIPAGIGYMAAAALTALR